MLIAITLLLLTGLCCSAWVFFTDPSAPSLIACIAQASALVVLALEALT